MRSIGKMEGELIFGYNWLFVMEYSILAAMRVFMRYEATADAGESRKKLARTSPFWGALK